MLKQIQKGTFPTLIAITALSVSASAAFYSVSGLSKLFAGASFEVMIMASSLEVAKLVVVSLLHNYWKELNRLLKVYLTIASSILILITSMGIYGFLSSAYQETYSKLNAVENQKSFIQQKVDFYQTDVSRYDEELKRISTNISTLSNAKASSIQIKDTSVVGGIRTTISTSELRMAQKRIEVEEKNRKEIQIKRETVADSLQKYQLQILELDNNNEVAGELGPLQYISGLTGVSMDRIINWLLLVIVFVFDPLAIALVIAANFAFDRAFPKVKYKENLYGEQVENLGEITIKPNNLQEEMEVGDNTPQDGLDELEDEEKVEGEKDILDLEVNHEELPLEVKIEPQLVKPKKSTESPLFNPLVDKEPKKNHTLEEVKSIRNHIKSLENRLAQGLSPWRSTKIKNEIEIFKKSLPPDTEGDTITY